MLDLQAITQRASARTAANPANPANRLIGERDASTQRISQLATLAGVADEFVLGVEETDAGSVSQLATLAGVAEADGYAIEAVTPATPATPATCGDGSGQESGSKVAAVAGVAGDERITCGQCRHFVPKARMCRNHRRAGIGSPLLGLDLPTLPQRCPGFASGPPVACAKVGPCAAPSITVTGHSLKGQT